MAEIERERDKKLSSRRLRNHSNELIDQTVLCSIVTGQIVSHGARKKNGEQSRAGDGRGGSFKSHPPAGNA